MQAITINAISTSGSTTWDGGGVLPGATLGCRRLRYSLADESVQQSSQPDRHLHVRRMTDAVKDVEKSTVLSQGEVFRQHLIDADGGVVIPAHQQHRHGQFA